MAEHVEARSLAALNSLAANPPQYPKKPTEQRQDPLTLYISRVPGTRDIILSTLKPQVKNVTAEDVASSLYYVHLELPEDEALLPPSQRQSPSPRSSEESPRSQILRKPLPLPAEPVHSRLNEVANAPSPPSGKENQGPSTGAISSRRPIPPATDGAVPPPLKAIASYPPPTTEPIHRKPLGPRLPAVEPTGQISTVLPPTSSYAQPPPAYSLPGESEERAPPLPVRPKDPLTEPFPSAPLAPPPLMTSRSPSPTKRRPFQPFSLTLIRRDPSSGQQWNVGKVASFQLENPELLNTHDEHGKQQPQPSPSISVHIETSGYAKFRGMPIGINLGPGVRPSIDIPSIRSSLDKRPGSSGSAAGRLQGLTIPDVQMHVPTSRSGAFERQVKMTYSPSFTSNLKQRFRRRSSASEDRQQRSPSPFKNQSGHNRYGSQASVGSFGGDFEGGSPPAITMPAPGLKPRGYMFYSPWDGRCEFVTGNGGRSLRCRHVLPSHSTGGGVFNPLVAGGGDGLDGDGGDGSDRRRRRGRSIGSPPANANPVSELRFNLPSSELFPDKERDRERERGYSSPQEGAARARDQLQSQMRRALARAQGALAPDGDGDSDYEDESYRLDLSLGREKAGGGNRGKRAKMGKLIVFDEGLKMLDLVVAANVGVWWITWERSFGGREPLLGDGDVV
ncbi:hypothetical protein F5Y15DRAFT_381032 [Xylariaceae sp. FL0016]|nr:hypothetical protein F5Y15DRAFT_381032 [Xylariaceae sp. FL0016]